MPNLGCSVNLELALRGMILVAKSIDDARTDIAAAQRLRAIVDAHGGNKEFARISGIPLGSLNNYLSGVAMKLPTLIKVADAARMTLDEVVGRAVTPQRVTSDTTELFIPIPHLEVRASAGSGLAPMMEEGDEGRQIAFRSSWLRALGIAPQNAEFLTAEGDSMWPTIHDGDLMLVDRGYGEVVNGKIYVLVVNGLVVVKRVSLLAFGGLMLIADNERYPSETVPRSEVENLNFQARVAWFGRPI
ncbi:LexA family transcriptional regulator [Methylobacterium iners]|uniref:HTH-type transcriptional regulator n=1 Tax=Methylobacterium iners TaxID=418707 RepID=A0ABQ4RUM2_9HYPH|nr:LexA family transcriptional regulator [Methylobacterium iners]GJD93404.1 putative HTH-type transcriptional regulator [Methylobacterium iners]